MAGFVFEKDLPHQTRAVEGVLRAFEGVDVQKAHSGSQNPELALKSSLGLIKSNLETLAKERDFQQAYTIDLKEPVFDISMETGTGKTYAYTKTMFELNKQKGIAKFIVAVPRVAIKAGTVSFLKSDAAREHFRDEFGKDIKVYEVQSQKKGKAKKDRMPQAIADFCRADIEMNKSAIHVMVINAGMITAKKAPKSGGAKIRTLDWEHEVSLLDEFHTPNDAIIHTKPVLIVDEPHMFKRGNATYQEMMRFKPQVVLRYGATFDGDLVNMVNELTAVEAFNTNLVKGVIAHVEKFDEGKDVSLRLVDLTGTEGVFELDNQGKKSKHSLSKGDRLERIHHEMKGLEVASLNKSKLVLSNGLEMKRSDKISPYSYAESLQDKMMQNAVRVHFETERELFLAENKIKPLTLFFIDNIESYRGDEPVMKNAFEAFVKAHIEGLIPSETDEGYKAHLEAALADISALHGGYFSKDNSDKDEAIENETLEILHEKEKLLSFENPRRFIFSKWTLREGWDNPNVFTICKLRSSGSDTSKLQEVGRGLRLPVNEYMSREKDKNYYLNYFVDFTESDFVDRLVGEINSKSKVDFDKDKLGEALIARILSAYAEFENDEDKLLEKLDDLGTIKRNNDFKEGGYDKIKAEYPLAFSGGVKGDKVKQSGKDAKLKATIRAGKYDELKELWERLNKKVVLEYKFDNDEQLLELFKDYLKSKASDFSKIGSTTEVHKIQVDEARANAKVSALETKFTPISLMTYQSFLQELSMSLAIGSRGMHEIFKSLKGELDISKYLSQVTIRKINKGFNDYLMQNVFGKFEVAFKETNNAIHPSKLTSKNGNPLSNIESGEVGVMHEDGNTPKSYLFDEIFYDGQLELENIKSDIEEVVVYSKIPKNSIRIPLVGGGSYSPDFAYVIKDKDGKQALNLLVETKGKDEISLSELEAQKIKHAEKLFSSANSDLSVRFESQLSGKAMQELIAQAIAS